MRPTEPSRQLQRNKLALLRQLDAAASLDAAAGGDDAVESAIANYELAFRMQTAVPELMDLAGETAATKRAVRPRRRLRADAPRSAGSACSPGGWSSAACGSSS